VLARHQFELHCHELPNFGYTILQANRSSGNFREVDGRVRCLLVVVFVRSGGVVCALI
jgi:hypothetical protein